MNCKSTFIFCGAEGGGCQRTSTSSRIVICDYEADDLWGTELGKIKKSQQVTDQK